MNRHTIGLLLAGSIAGALSSSATRAPAAQAENCYGVALKGQNDCAATAHSCAGQSQVDYDGESWKAVPAGSCVAIKTPFGSGALTPIKRPG
jgi:uncharacterized membrane protein